MDKKWLSNKIRQACETYADGNATTERLDAVDDAYTYAIAQAHEQEMAGAPTWEANHQQRILEQHGLADEFPYGCDSIDYVAEALLETRRQLGQPGQLAIMPCGHHASNVVGADAGTAYCKMCELEGRVKKLQAKEGLLHRQVSLDIGKVAVMAEVLVTLRERYTSALQSLDEAGHPFVNAYLRELQDLDARLQSAPKVLWHGKAHFRQRYTVDLPKEADDALGHLKSPWEVDVLILEGPSALQEQSKATMPDSEYLPKGKHPEKSEQ